jgi:AAA domain-containing protein
VTWDPINLAKLEERPQAQPTLGNAGLVYNRLRHVFSGAQESAKTLAAYAITLAVVRDGGTVLLLDLEMGMWDARDRLREMGATDDDLGRILYVEPEAPAYDSTMGEFIHLGPALVVIDAAAGAYAIQDLDDNKRRDAELFANLWVRPFWQADVATIVLDHVVKNADNRGKYAIGSERKVGGVEVAPAHRRRAPLQERPRHTRAHLGVQSRYRSRDIGELAADGADGTRRRIPRSAERTRQPRRHQTRRPRQSRIPRAGDRLPRLRRHRHRSRIAQTPRPRRPNTPNTGMNVPRSLPVPGTFPLDERGTPFPVPSLYRGNDFRERLSTSLSGVKG